MKYNFESFEFNQTNECCNYDFVANETFHQNYF